MIWMQKSQEKFLQFDKKVNNFLYDDFFGLVRAGKIAIIWERFDQ